MGRRRAAKNRTLPPNLYLRNGYYSWRDPRTNKEYGLGRDRSSAIEQAIEANLLASGHFSPHRLIDRLTGAADRTALDWYERYIIILEKRGIKPGSITAAKDQLRLAMKQWGATPLERISVMDVADLLKTWTDASKERMAASVRGRLSDYFREAIAAGWIDSNPADVTRVHGLRTKRERLTLDAYMTILTAAEADLRRPWAASAIKLALLTGQRREDLVNLRPGDIKDGWLYITQEKTGMKLRLALDLRLNALPQSLGEVIAECLDSGIAQPETIIHARQAAYRVRPGQQIRKQLITRAFADARDLAGHGTGEAPPTLHEIRSLSGRLYEEQHGARFAQMILGHRSAQTTAVYLDSRNAEWLTVTAPNTADRQS